MFVGAEHVGDFSGEHNLSVRQRALLQGYDCESLWPRDASEPKQKDMVAQVILPPFAKVLSTAVFEHQTKALREVRLQEALCAPGT